MPAIRTASALEIAWSLIAFAGIVFAILNALDRFEDLGWLHGSGLNGARLLSAKAHLREELFAVVKLSLALTIGVIAMFTPSAAQSAEGHVIVLVSSLCIVGIELIIVAGSVFRFHDRRMLIADLAHERPRRPRPLRSSSGDGEGRS